MTCFYCGEPGRVEDCPICGRLWSVLTNERATSVYTTLVEEVRKESIDLGIPLEEVDMEKIAAERYLDLVEGGFVE